jgi:hypothetical protein
MFVIWFFVEEPLQESPSRIVVLLPATTHVAHHICPKPRVRKAKIKIGISTKVGHK